MTGGFHCSHPSLSGGVSVQWKNFAEAMFQFIGWLFYKIKKSSVDILFLLFAIKRDCSSDKFNLMCRATPWWF